MIGQFITIVVGLYILIGIGLAANEGDWEDFWIGVAALCLGVIWFLLFT